jgi:hypothetical protein
VDVLGQCKLCLPLCGRLAGLRLTGSALLAGIGWQGVEKRQTGMEFPHVRRGVV